MSNHLPKSMPIDPGVLDAYRTLEEAQLARAIRRRQRETLEKIRFRHGQGMSRARLVQIYGWELVRFALGVE